MKIENITEVKKRFTQIVRELPETGMVVVTKDGRPAAVVMEAVTSRIFFVFSTSTPSCMAVSSPVNSRFRDRA